MGIETEKFVSAVDDDFMCMICTLVMDNPVRLSSCEHMFCRTCLDEWMNQSATCPVDRNTIDGSQLIAPDRTVVSMLNKLMLKCEFHLLGCEEVIQLESWKSHLNQCNFNPDNKQSCVGCGNMLERDEKDSHRCLEMLEVENMKLKQEINELKYLLSDYQSTCERMEKEIEKLKEENYLFLADRNACASSNIETMSVNRVSEENRTSSIDKWVMLSRLPQNLKTKIRLASVLGTGEDFEALFITDDDEVFWVNADKETVDYKNDCQPKKAEKLSGLRIKDLVYGCGFISDPFVCALTDDGELFTWYFNKKSLKETRRSFKELRNKKVAEVACGAYHFLALTEDGGVFAWGSDLYGQLGTGSGVQCELTQVTIKIETLRIVAVACCNTSSFALTDNGEVYSWGKNDYGQLGINNETRKTPTKINALEGVNVRRLSCGFSHVFVVADDGSIFAWGQNDYGQLGTGDKKNKIKPVKIGPPEVKFIEVAAAYYYTHLSVALSEDGRCWVWGMCRTGSERKEIKRELIPKPVESASIHDAIAEYAYYQMTWKTMEISNNCLDKNYKN